MILVLTEHGDAHADRVLTALGRRDVEFVRFDPAEFPARASLTLTHAQGTVRRVLRTADAVIDLERVHVVWTRRPGTPTPGPELSDPFARAYAAEECAWTLNDALRSLPCAWLPGARHAIHDAHFKFRQLALAAELGFVVPDTVVTSRPRDALDFHAELGDVISKLPGPSLFRQAEQPLNRYTERVRARDLAYVDALRHAPAAFQRRIDKQVELRVTVVGDRAFAAEIDSQGNRRTQLDWRRYDLDHTPHMPHALPAETHRRTVALTHALGLRYGAIDLVLTPSGEYVFLEINPNGHFLWIEDEAGLPISEAIADWLGAHDHAPCN
jgi:hypothetical protein